MLTQPYLFFNGRTEEALKFYEKAVGAKVEALMRFSDAPQGEGGDNAQNANIDKVMHANVRIGKDQVMVSDGYCSGEDATFDGFALTLTVQDDAEAKRLFDNLSEGGEVTMPFGPTFFASSFGSVKDKFGLGWMVINPLEK